MSDAFSAAGVGPDTDGWRDVTIPTGKASIEWYGVSITDLHDHAEARYRCAGDCSEITYDQIAFAAI